MFNEFTYFIIFESFKLKKKLYQGPNQGIVPGNYKPISYFIMNLYQM